MLRIPTPIPGPLLSSPSHLPSHTASLRLLLLTDPRCKLRQLLYRFHASKRLLPHLPNHPEFISTAFLRFLAKSAPQLLHADDECLLAQSVRFDQEDCVRFLLERGANVNIGWEKYLASSAPSALQPSTNNLGTSSGFDNKFVESCSEKVRKDLVKLSVPLKPSSSSLLSSSSLSSSSSSSSPPRSSLSSSSSSSLSSVRQEPPLLVAARNGNLPIVKLFIEYGADLSLDIEGELVMAASEKKNWDLLELLLKNGAPFIPRLNHSNSYRTSSRAGLRKTRVLEQVVLADSHGEADLLPIWKLLLESAVYYQGFLSNTIYAEAVKLCSRLGNVRFLHWLVTSCNLEFDYLDLRYCCSSSSSLNVLKYLLINKLVSSSDLDFRDLLSDKQSQTVAHFRLYLDHGANPNVNKGRILKDCAALGLNDIVEFLIVEANIYLEACGEDALISALRYGQPEVVSLLLDHGVCPASLMDREILCYSEHGRASFNYYIMFDSPKEASFRIRAALDRFRLREQDFFEAIDAGFRHVDCVREIVAREPEGGCIKYWLEDTAMEMEVVEMMPEPEEDLVQSCSEEEEVFDVAADDDADVDCLVTSASMRCGGGIRSEPGKGRAATGEGPPQQARREEWDEWRKMSRTRDPSPFKEEEFKFNNPIYFAIGATDSMAELLILD